MQAGGAPPRARVHPAPLQFGIAEEKGGVKNAHNLGMNTYRGRQVISGELATKGIGFVLQESDELLASGRMSTVTGYSQRDNNLRYSTRD